MKKYSRRKFVETAVMTGVGAAVLPDLAQDKETMLTSGDYKTGQHRPYLSPDELHR